MTKKLAEYECFGGALDGKRLLLEPNLRFGTVIQLPPTYEAFVKDRCRDYLYRVLPGGLRHVDWKEPPPDQVVNCRCNHG